MKIADPVFSSITIGENGESQLRWVNDGFYTEYRFNIREIEFSTSINSKEDNVINLGCISNVNNCLQRAFREMISRAGDKVTYAGYKSLEIPSIGGFDNVLSIKNALVYLKVLSLTDNNNKTSNKRDPFLN